MAHKVLIVEDNPLIARIWSNKLNNAGFETRMADSGPSARAAMLEWSPDAVLLDVVLPETDGLELCREWKADSRTAGTRILCVSALSSKEDIDAAREAGANGYIPKSTNAPKQLIAALHRHLSAANA